MPDEPTGSPTTRRMPPGTDPDTARALESMDLRDAMIAGLAAGANDLTAAAVSLAGAARLTRLEKTIALVLLAVNTIGMLGIAVVSVVVLTIAQDNRQARLDGAVTLREALDRVLRTQVIVKECDRLLAGDSYTPPRFEACVADRIARLPE